MSLEMKSDELILVKYGEIGLKSPPVRRRFEKRLIKNIRSRINAEIVLEGGRILIYPEDMDEALDNLGKISGIVSFSPAIYTKTDFKTIRSKLKGYIRDLIGRDEVNPLKSFAVRCRRVGKHEFTSQEMAAFCGSVIVELTGAPVNLSNPQWEIYVEVRDNKTFLYHKKMQGLGGLPVGTQGRVMVLLSAGIDSPVAAFLMLKRGCSISLVNFKTPPYNQKNQEKIEKIKEKLEEYSAGSKIRSYQVDYARFLQECQVNAPPRLTCVLCKVGMYIIAEKLAKQDKALALVDGSSLGQVASQTLPNIVATRSYTKIPILSPLIGLDKIEIENIAKKIGTYQISIMPEEACSMVPAYPETNADQNFVSKICENLNMDEMINTTMHYIKKF